MLQIIYHLLFRRFLQGIHTKIINVDIVLYFCHQVESERRTSLRSTQRCISHLCRASESERCTSLRSMWRCIFLKVCMLIVVFGEKHCHEYVDKEKKWNSLIEQKKKLTNLTPADVVGNDTGEVNHLESTLSCREWALDLRLYTLVYVYATSDQPCFVNATRQWCTRVYLNVM